MAHYRFHKGRFQFRVNAPWQDLSPVEALNMRAWHRATDDPALDLERAYARYLWHLRFQTLVARLRNLISFKRA
ncbi:hypothetical protein [Asticcacaulis sp.]|uniref:hypothetical protein n=1 Tax=Asticcacaulis sp. TaxID=1872648 RepID=UPI0031CDC837